MLGIVLAGVYALLRFDIDLRFLFYDLTAFVVHGAYTESALADYGFAHNTPSDKQKIKVGATATGDGFIPIEYAPWSGRTADQATVQQNYGTARLPAGQSADHRRPRQSE